MLYCWEVNGAGEGVHCESARGAVRRRRREVKREVNIFMVFACGILIVFALL
jgi:hypothetical protein